MRCTGCHELCALTVVEAEPAVTGSYRVQLVNESRVSCDGSAIDRLMSRLQPSICYRITSFSAAE